MGDVECSVVCGANDSSPASSGTAFPQQTQAGSGAKAAMPKADQPNQREIALSGGKWTMIRCHQCGTDNLDGSEYCDECGNKLIAAASVRSVPAQKPAAPPPPQFVPPP